MVWLLNLAVVVWADGVSVSGSRYADQGTDAAVARVHREGSVVHGNMRGTYRIDGEINILELQKCRRITFGEFYRTIDPPLWHFCRSFCYSCTLCLILFLCFPYYLVCYISFILLIQYSDIICALLGYCIIVLSCNMYSNLYFYQLDDVTICNISYG